MIVMHWRVLGSNSCRPGKPGQNKENERYQPRGGGRLLVPNLSGHSPVSVK
jgi:hypothetical protein